MNLKHTEIYIYVTKKPGIPAFFNRLLKGLEYDDFGFIASGNVMHIQKHQVVFTEPSIYHYAYRVWRINSIDPNEFIGFINKQTDVINSIIYQRPHAEPMMKCALVSRVMRKAVNINDDNVLFNVICSMPCAAEVVSFCALYNEIFEELSAEQKLGVEE